jgi:hypothetical protein
MSFRKLQWFFPIAVTLHNCEEAVYMPRWVSRHSKDLAFQPAATRIWFGLMVLTGAAFFITFLSYKKGRQSTWTYLLFGYAVAMLANVFVPHIPATLFFRAYTPGVVTAVLVNLPIMIFLLFRAKSDDWVSGSKAVAYAVLVPLTIGILIWTLLFL